MNFRNLEMAYSCILSPHIQGAKKLASFTACHSGN